MNVARINEMLIDSLGKMHADRRPYEGNEVYNFFVVMVVLDTTKVQEHAAEMIELLKDWPNESWGHPIPPLGGEISYLMAGGVLGDQSMAFMLFAFGKILGWWDILDPHTVLNVPYDDSFGHHLVGAGMVSINGYRPTVVVS